jgi:outer membrane protein
MKSTLLSRSAATLVAVALLSLGAGAVPAGAQTTPSAATTPNNANMAPPAVGAPIAVPSPIASLPPASQPLTLPYPAYGTPAPGVNRGVPSADVPEVVTVDQAIAIGFAVSPLLAQARATVKIDTAPVDLAKTAILPDITGTYSLGRSYHQQGTATTGNGQITTNGGNIQAATTTSSLGVALKQLIYDGGKVAAQLRAAKATQSSAIALYKRQLQTVAFNVANAYYAALAAQRATQVAAETVKINQVNANLVAAQIRAGTAAKSDYLTAELPVAQARVALVRDQGSELSAQAAFVNAMGLDANTYVLPQDDGNVLSGASGAPTVNIPSYALAIERAYLLRPDYAAAQYSVQSYQANLKAARLGLFPVLDGTADYATAASSPLGGAYRNNGDVGVTLSIPLFDQGVTHAQVLQAQGQLDSAVATLVTTRENIQLNVKQTLVSLISARAAFDQTQVELANARQVLQATQAQYAAGVTTLPLLLNAQVGLTTALADQVTAVYTLRQAEAAFLFAEGANAPA